ncbi:MAG: hypothetical protein JHC94_09205 [Acidimicrobiia bacterium]|nr:hypothetical protein [Acidimicrobiia bacterium]
MAHGSLSSWDDYPVHQVSETIRHSGTSDRNFYDRYYFNLHGSSDDLFMIMGMGQYPNLGTQDAFASVRRGEEYHVVRASKLLGDRMDTSVGPFRVEIIEPLQRVRFILDPPKGAEEDRAIACDVTWEGAMPAFEEPRQYVRKFGRVLFDTMRFAQTGCWSGSVEVAGESFSVTPDRWKGTRDRSWGVRPVGETEPSGIREEVGQMVGLWNYAPMQFDDFSILYIVQEEPDGHRTIEESVRIWADRTREPEWLGRPEFEHRLDSGTRMISTQSKLKFPDAPGGGFEVVVTPLLHSYIAIGTGYGVGDEFRHGMYRGTDLVVESKTWSMAELETWGWFGLVDHVARFEIGDQVGYGLHEHGIFGAFPKFGLESGYDTAK